MRTLTKFWLFLIDITGLRFEQSSLAEFMPTADANFPFTTPIILEALRRRRNQVIAQDRSYILVSYGRKQDTHVSA